MYQKYRITTGYFVTWTNDIVDQPHTPLWTMVTTLLLLWSTNDIAMPPPTVSLSALDHVNPLCSEPPMTTYSYSLGLSSSYPSSLFHLQWEQENKQYSVKATTETPPRGEHHQHNQHMFHLPSRYGDSYFPSQAFSQSLEHTSFPILYWLSIIGRKSAWHDQLLFMQQWNNKEKGDTGVSLLALMSPHDCWTSSARQNHFAWAGQPGQSLSSTRKTQLFHL